MKTDSITKVLLALIALALVFMAGEGVVNHQTIVRAAAPLPQQWQYRSVRIKYHTADGVIQGEASVNVDGTEMAPAPSRAALLKNAGQGGWELATDLFITHGSVVQEIMEFKQHLH